MDECDKVQPRTNGKLDVEDEEQRQNRIQSFLEKLNSTSTPKSSFLPSFGSKATHAVHPQGELISRVQAFLPQLEVSNNLLAKRVCADPKSVDIEHVEEGVGQYIEMNLGLGVFEDRTRSKAHEDQDTEMTSSSSETSESEEDDNSEADSDASSQIITSFNPVRLIKPLPKRKVDSRPQIIVLGEKL